MPEPIFIGACAASYIALQAYARRGGAISADALAAREAATAVVQNAERSQALFGEKALAIFDLRTLANDCAALGSDAGDATIHPDAVLIAEAFIRALPDGIPLPEFAAEPDGSVSLDWIQSQNHFFTLSVGTSHRLPYAWLDGADKGHAVARFDEGTIPPRILEGIRSILSYGNTTIGSA